MMDGRRFRRASLGPDENLILGDRMGHWGYIGVIFPILGVMEKKVETTIVYRGYIGVIYGLYSDPLNPKP